MRRPDWLATRAGPVRIVRGSIGAASGYGTTHYFTAYPTFFRDDVHLRVHNLDQAIRGYIDWNSAAANLNGQSCPVQNFDVWRGGDSQQVFNYVDGGCVPPPFTGLAEEPRQLNGPYISLVELFFEDPQHPIPASSKTLTYNEDGGAELEPGLEDESGAYGNIGMQFGSANATEEKSCMEVKFAGLARVWQPRVSDSGLGRANALDRDLRMRALEATTEYQCFGCGGGGGPSTPCAPTLSVNEPGNGFQTKLSLTSQCDGDLWFRAYRSVGTSGQFSVLSSLGAGTTFDDYRVERGQTYRYYAESYNAAGTVSSPSGTVTVTVTDVTSPSAPTIAGAVSGGSVSLSWDWTGDLSLTLI